MFRKVVSLLMAMVLVLSFIPAGAVATEMPSSEEATAASTEAPTVPATEEPTVPATEKPTVPATEAPVPATEEPTVPATEEPTVPATEEPAVPATEEPTVPATEEPTVPATEEPAVPATEEPTVPATEEPTVPATEEPTVPATEEPTVPATEPVATAPGSKKNIEEPVVSDVEFSMDISGVSSEVIPYVRLDLVHEDGVTTRSIVINNEYNWGYDCYSLPVGRYTVAVSGLSLEGYTVITENPDTLEVVEGETAYYYFSIIAFKPNASATIAVRFAESSDLKAADFPSGLELTYGNQYMSNYRITLNDSNNWSVSASHFSTGISVSVGLALPDMTGYNLTVIQEVDGSGYSSVTDPDFSTFEPSSVKTQIDFAEDADVTLTLVLDFEKYETGSVELSLDIGSDADLPEGQPEPATIHIFTESYDLRYEGSFTEDKITIPSLPVGSYYLDFYWHDVDGFASDASYPTSFIVAAGSVTTLDLSVTYSMLRYGSVHVNYVVETDKPIAEDQLPQPHISILGNSISFTEMLSSDGVTIEQVPTGQYSVDVSGSSVDGYTFVIETPDEVTVTEGETTELTVTVKYTAIKHGSATLQFKAIGDITQEELPSSLRGMFYDGYLDGGMNVNKYYVDLTPENNWTATAEDLPEGNYFFTVLDRSVDGYLITDTQQNSEFITVTEGTTAEAVYTVTYENANRYGNIEINVQLEDPSVTPDGARLVLSDNKGNEHTVWLWFDEDGNSYDTLYNLPVGEYTVNTSGCDVYGYEVVISGPSAITVEGAASKALNLTLSYTSKTAGHLEYHLALKAPNMSETFSDEQLAALQNSVSVTAIDAFGRKTVLKEDASDPFHYSAQELPAGDYTIQITGYELEGYEVRFEHYGAIVTVISGETSYSYATLLYYSNESSFSAKIQFAEGSVLNESNFPQGIEFWVYGSTLTIPVTGILNAENQWSTFIDLLPNNERIGIELKSPALDGYVLNSVDISDAYENCTRWYQANSKELPFTLTQTIQFYDKGTYDIVITLDIQKKAEDPETPDGSPLPFRFDLLPELPPQMGLDQLPENIGIRLKPKYSDEEYTATFRRSEIGEAPFAAYLDVPAGWCYISLENYELDGYAAYANGCIGECYLSDTGNLSRTINLEYGLANATAKVNIAFAETSALTEENFPGTIGFSFDPYTDLYDHNVFSAETGWSITYDNLFNALSPYDDIYSYTTPCYWSLFVDRIPGYGLRSLQVIDSEDNSFRNYADISNDQYSAGGSFDIWQDGTYEITFVLDFAKEDGTIVLQHEFDPDSQLQAEDFPNGIKINVHYPGHYVSDLSGDSSLADEVVTLGPDNNWTHTLTGLSYGSYTFNISNESIPEYYEHIVRNNDYGLADFVYLTGPDPVTCNFKSLFRSTLGELHVNISFAPDSDLSVYNFDGSISLMAGDEEFVLNRSNNFRQAKLMESLGTTGISYLSGHQVDGYKLTSVSYNGETFASGAGTNYYWINLLPGETAVLNIVLKYEALTSSQIAVTESFYEGTTAAILDRCAIKVYLTNPQGKILQRGVLNDGNCWTYVFNVPAEGGDYIVRQVHDVPENVAMYSDFDEKAIHLKPHGNANVNFMSDYRMTFTGPIRLDFMEGSLLDWVDFPNGYVLSLTDTTGRFTVTADIHDGFGLWGNGVLTIPAGTYEGFSLLNADKDGYLRTTTFQYGFREPGGASLRGAEPKETMLNGPMVLAYSREWHFNIENHYTRVGSLTVTNSETFAEYGGEQLSGSLNSGLESKSYTYEVKIGAESEIFTLEPGEKFVIDGILNGSEYTVSIIAEDGIAWNTPVMIKEGKIEGVDGDDSSFNHTVTMRHDYLYQFDEDGISARFVKSDEEGAPLSGAEFGIYADEGCTKLVESVTSGDDGKVLLHFGEAGTWYIKETEAPDGYQLSDQVLTVTVSQKWTALTRTDAEGEEVIVITEALEISIDGLTVDNGVPKFENTAIEPEDPAEPDDPTDPPNDGEEDPDSKEEAPTEEPEDSDDEDVPSSKPSGTTPATGDLNNPALYTFLFLLSLAALAVLMELRRKRSL